jgi:hypothetical protein
MSSEFSKLSDNQQAAVRRCVDSVQASLVLWLTDHTTEPVVSSTEHVPPSWEAYAYSGDSHAICWGVNNAQVNIARGNLAPGEVL